MADYDQEYTLDPQDWDALRLLGHQMVDDMMNMFQMLRERPVWHPIPNETKEHFKQDLPYEPEDAEAVYQEFREHILTNPMGNIHPRFWGWVVGTGTPLAMLAEMLASGLNPNVGGGDHIANYVELQVLDWLKEMLGYPPEASGLLVSGGSMANFVGLTVARNTKAPFNIRQEGLQGSSPKMVLYASTETHSSNDKAVELLGLGQKALRHIPVNDAFQIDIAALERAIAEDKAAGYFPFCIIGHAGITSTGAIDNLNTLADICQREGLWFHVDAAFGAWAVLAPELRPLVAGMERADSLAFDLHKWMYMPMEVGCTLVRRKSDHYNAFTLTPDYLAHGQGRGLAAGDVWFSDYGLQLTRNFRALKVWMSIKTHGVDLYAQLIRQNVDQALYLAGLVEASPKLECTAPVPLNVVCFRYVTSQLDAEKLNVLNAELLLRLHESGVAITSHSTLNGKYSLRAAITNYRSRREDFDILVGKVIELGDALLAEWT